MSVATMNMAKEMVITRLAEGDIVRAKSWLELYTEELKAKAVMEEIEKRKKELQASWDRSYREFAKYHDRNNY